VGVVLLLGGLGLVAATAALVALAAGVRGLVGGVLAVYVLGVAEVTALTEALSLVHAVGRWQYLACELVLVAAAAWWWDRRGRPLPAHPVLDPLGSPLVLALGVIVGLALTYEAFLVLTTPPNTWDSLAYHLPRAAEWYQRGAVEFLPDVHTDRMNAYQPGAEMQILYTFALARNDLLAELPQWLAQLALLAAVYGIARRIGWGRPAAAFAALLTATLTELALESVTTQNDLVVAALGAAAAFFILGQTRTDVALGGLALGLALGTKLTVALAVPALALLALAAGGVRRLAWGAGATLIAFLLVGSYGYALNLIHTGSPLGEAATNAPLQPERTFDGTVSTVARVGFRLIDLSGYSVDDDILAVIGDAGRWTFDTLHIPVNPDESTLQEFAFFVNTAPEEDNSYFGPLGFLLLVPLSVVFLVRFAARRAGRTQAALAAALPLYILGLALAYRYNPWIGRFLLTPVALTMPLAAVVYRFRALAALVAVVGVATLSVAHRHSTTHPTGAAGQPVVWRLDRASTIALRFPPMKETLWGVDNTVPENVTILALVGENDFVYALYGPNLTRRVHTVSPADLGAERWNGLLRVADERGAGWILGNGSVAVEPAPGWRVLTTYPGSGWTLLKRS
jgi:4-amino-4-deoxy-L-arabinose transferase-like glycosyltransferase